MKTSSPVPLTLRFGVFELDPRAGELRKKGMRMRLQGQPVDILAMLLERPGETITREELQKKLWPADTFVDFEQGLNSAMKRLRAALDDNAESPRFIETLPRHGYRFVGSVNGAGHDLAVEADAPASARSWRFLWPALAVFALTLVLVPFALFKGQPPAPKITGATQLTTDGRKKTGKIATDGLRIYFSELVDDHWTVAAVSTSGGQAAPIRTPFKDAQLLNISPDRSELLVGAGSPFDEMPLWRVPIWGGTPRRLGTMLAHDGSWSPDGRRFVYTNGAALYLAKSDGTGPRELVHGDSDLSVWAWHPTWSPDGSRIQFSLFHMIKNVGALWEIRVDGKNPHQVFPDSQNLPVQCCGSWTPDGRYYLFNRWRGMIHTANAPADIWAIREKTGVFGKRILEPIQLTVGPLRFWDPIPSLDGKVLFTTSLLSRGELLRYDAKARQLSPYLSGISAEGMSYSKDGLWMAYVTFPEGELWRSRIDGSQSLQLTFFPMIAYAPDWSPDGKRILYSGLKAGEEWQTYVVSADGGAPQRLFPESVDGIDATWSPDGNEVLFGHLPTVPGTNDIPPVIKIINLQTQRVSVVPGSEGLRSPMWSPDGRYISATSTRGGRVMLFDARSQKWTEQARDTGNGCFRAFSRDAKYLYFLGGSDAADQGIFRVAVSTNKREKILSLKGFRSAGTWGEWLSLTLEDDPLVLRDAGPPEIYALSWDAP